MPTSASSAAPVEEAIARVPETSYGFRTRLQFVIDTLVSHGLELDETTEVLDVGCGTGEMLAVPLARIGLQVIGIDEHLPSIEYARALANGTSAEFRTDSAADVRTTGKRFDVTICSEVLEHLHEPEEMLRHLRALTKEGGFCIVTVPNGLGAFEQSVRFRHFYDGSFLRPLYHAIRAPFRWLIGRSPSAALQTSVERPTQTLNADSGHVQFYRWCRLRRMFDQADWSVATYRGRTMLCGHFLDPIVDRYDAVVRANAALAAVLPTSLASGWMFVLKPKPATK